jgi:hypothetical protein
MVHAEEYSTEPSQALALNAWVSKIQAGSNMKSECLFSKQLQAGTVLTGFLRIWSQMGTNVATCPGYGQCFYKLCLVLFYLYKVSVIQAPLDSPLANEIFQFSPRPAVLINQLLY